MAKVDPAAVGSTTPCDISAVREDEIRPALAAILSSVEFRTSKRSQDFLRFVVEQTLLGRGAELKERTIGIEAFGRAASYDTNGDGVVRIKASEVRRRLNAYYAGPSARGAEVRIELPVGGYAPHFTRVVHGAEVLFPRPPVAAEVRPSGNWWRWMLAATAVVAVACCVVFIVRTHQDASVLHAFWGPVLGNGAPVLIATAYVPVYEREGLRPGEAPTASNYVLLDDQYVGGGDLIASTRVAGLLSRLKHPYVVKVGTVAFEDMRNAPTVMIGYSSDRWSAISSQLRFYIDDDHGTITDNGKPTQWYPRALDRRFHTNEDYAIVSRVFDKQTNAMLVEVTGVTQYGTEAAGEVVTDSDLLSEALQGAPSKWQGMNLQLVLHMSVISNYPASPKVVGSYYW